MSGGSPRPELCVLSAVSSSKHLRSTLTNVSPRPGPRCSDGPAAAQGVRVPAGVSGVRAQPGGVLRPLRLHQQNTSDSRENGDLQSPTASRKSPGPPRARLCCSRAECRVFLEWCWGKVVLWTPCFQHGGLRLRGSASGLWRRRRRRAVWPRRSASCYRSVI